MILSGVWVHVGKLDGLPDLALNAYWLSPGDGELVGLGVPPVLRTPVAR